MNYIDIDGNKLHGDNITVDKNSNRLVFDLSVLGFRPNKGYNIYYKLDGVDNDYQLLNDGSNNVSYTNLNGGTYTFHAYVLDEFGQKSNEINITVIKPKHIYEETWFWVLMVILGLVLIALINLFIIGIRTKASRKREEELKATTINAIETTAKIIDARDAYTNGHSSRVGYYSWLIAKELGIKGNELDNIYYIALLHDVGKIGVRDHILNKPGRLTDEEFVVMKSHAAIGGEILKDIHTIPNIEEGARYHHERWDGNGYPEGKKGEDIPYIARIICCADCYDAMATKRVYKEPYPEEKIISEFERCAGTQFDPNIAPVVIKLIKEGKLSPNIDIKKIDLLMKSEMENSKDNKADIVNSENNKTEE